MGRVARTLAQIIGVASLVGACSDDNETCTPDQVPGFHDVLIGSAAGGAGGAEAAAGGASTAVDCHAFCGTPQCQIMESPFGDVVARCVHPYSEPTCSPPGVSVGRRPASLHEAQTSHEPSLGSLFARTAHLEAASVFAFARLQRELRAHGARREMLAATRRAARDEVRHARQMSALARQHHTRVPRVALGPFRVRALPEIAAENEVEGCVRETYGALVALWQATHAGTPELRALFHDVARDEARHAELAWQLRGWLRGQLSGDQQRRLDDAQRAALQALDRELTVPPPAEWRDVAGLPDTGTARHLLALLRERMADAAFGLDLS